MFSGGNFLSFYENITPLIGVGLSEHLQAEVSIFPNPTTGVINFQSDQKIKSIRILSLTGQKVNQFNNTNTINISHLPSGIYTATIQMSNGNNALRKLVKE